MKRMFCLFLLAFLLAGCAVREPAPTETTPPTEEPTQPPIPWVEEVGLPWDEAGYLRELPLTIPDGLNYSMAMEFDGDLLLWSMDNHLADTWILELCLVELDDGTVTAQRDIACSQAVHPQILGDSMYLCDNLSGTILELNKQLEVVNTWSLEPQEANWIMGGSNTLYIQNWEEPVRVLDLTTGQESTLLGGALVTYISPLDTMATVEYYSPDTGVQEMVLLDLMTGQLLMPPRDGSFMSMDCRNGTWLISNYRDGYTYYLGTEENLMLLNTETNDLRFLESDILLQTGEDGTRLTLHDLRGKALASCCLTENGFGLYCNTLIPNENLGGYFCLVSNYESSQRLLYWDTTQGEQGEDLEFTDIPEEDQIQAQLRQRAQEISQRFGIHVLVGTDCATEFTNFSTEQVTVWEDVSYALNVLESALESYPEGFFLQLRYGEIHRVELQLVGTLTATNPDSYPGSYAAFAQENYDHSLVVADIYSTTVETYYHEFSHLIDVFLQWDAWQRVDALFSETHWIGLNPDWFTGYSYQYGNEHELHDYSSFITSYATVSPTEDRAQIMEYAMREFDVFTGSPVLIDKLEYYGRCIRDAFDTTGWPEQVIWEQYL